MNRKVKALSIGLLVLVALWFVWLHIANKRLAAKLAELQANGEPIVPADFAISIPDEQNAAKYFEAAANAISTTVDCPANSNLSYLKYPPFPAAWHQLANASMVANQRALSLARAARPFDRASWAIASPSSTGVSALSLARSLANVLGDAALLTHERGDDAAAMEYLLDVFHEEDSLSQSSSKLNQRWVAIGIDALACVRLEVISADNMQVKDAAFHDPPTTQPIQAVDRRVVEQLIQRLLDDKRESEGELRALRGERVLSVDSLQALVPHATVLRPLLKLEEIQLINYYAIILTAAGEPNRPAIEAVIDRAVAGKSLGFSMNVVSTLVLPFRSFLETECRALALRRVAAVSLAARLYRCDHGHWPSDLNLLVPRYLPKVPSDPFLNPDSPLGYLVESLPAGKERPVVYFELGGKVVAATPPSTPCFDWQMNKGRQWHDLSLWTTPSPPQTADHHP